MPIARYHPSAKAMGAAGGIRDIRALAKRVHQRWLEYRRRYPGRSVPISDTLARILEHDPDYKRQRHRVRRKERQPLRNPGVFTLKEIADALETTVGDLLGEPQYTSVRDAISEGERRQLRDAVVLLQTLFDLHDESLPTAQTPDAEPYLLPVSARDFIVNEHTYPTPLHVWMVPASDAALDIRLLREAREPHLSVIRIIGDSMAPELPADSKVVIDTQRTTPTEDMLVAVYIEERGGVIGRWRTTADGAMVYRTNPAAAPVALPEDGGWIVLGMITTIVKTGR